MSRAAQCQRRRRRLAAGLASALLLAACSEDPAPSGAFGTAGLESLPPNRWVSLHEARDLGWHRQGHAGAAYDRRRGHLLLFGSDTHGRDWDNTVHRFDPATRRWQRSHPPADPDSYRADGSERAVAGPRGDQPWAMHTYDGVLYDALADALFVASHPLHNPRRQEVSAELAPFAWRHGLETGEWRALPAPTSLFLSASAYDERRETIVVYSNGIWELGPERSQWLQASAESHHNMHHTMAYDSRSGSLAVFGDQRSERAREGVWLYHPGTLPGDAGRWEYRRPGGDECPADQHFPAAYSPDHGVYLLLPDEGGEDAERAVTCVYDPERNRYRRLPEATLPAQGMNFMMVYDRRREVFLLVTGSHAEPTTVWALRLERSAS
ncbi:kelch repeat-containing protein [Sediminicurvatus halobius]|uniref:Galactose oxidase n=1 Tax=Sediminicurvatus halobius TaxID=2182432 RepID=A0A2U2MX91_9GAMM|nr:kelch repeat-containing protein [Spiribacter halobius]PWG61459.1 hypothetical protein DEM34_16300 [Spiribacter halobius]UEX77244.1 hypothetical protein LMH63_15020 [Spiribacter halobius]